MVSRDKDVRHIPGGFAMLNLKKNEITMEVGRWVQVSLGMVPLFQTAANFKMPSISKCHKCAVLFLLLSWLFVHFLSPSFLLLFHSSCI